MLWESQKRSWNVRATNYWNCFLLLWMKNSKYHQNTKCLKASKLKEMRSKKKKLYQNQNSYQIIYSKLYLKVFILKECHMISKLKKFCLRFKIILNMLIIQKVFNKHMKCVWFLKKLLVSWQQKILSKQNIDVLNFTTINFKQIYNVAWAKLQSNKQKKLINEIT